MKTKIFISLVLVIAIAGIVSADEFVILRAETLISEEQLEQKAEEGLFLNTITKMNEQYYSYFIKFNQQPFVKYQVIEASSLPSAIQMNEFYRQRWRLIVIIKAENSYYLYLVKYDK